MLCPRFLDPPEPNGPSQEQTAKVKLLLPEAWLGFTFQVDRAKCLLEMG